MGIWRFAGAFAVVERQSECGSKTAGMPRLSGYAILFRCTKGPVCCWDLQSQLFVFLGFSIRYQVFSLQMYELLFNVTTFYSFI